jgi:hypothetical protein
MGSIQRRELLMKALCTVFVILSSIALVGCSGSTSDKDKVGGPGASQSSDKTPSLTGPKEGEFALKPPLLSESVKQGASDVVTIGISRGKNFDENVALAFTDVPSDVTIEPKVTAIKKDEKEAKVTVKVGDKAPLGKHDIKVTGKALKGEAAETHFTLNVKEK